MVSKTQKKMNEMEEIVNEYGNMIEAIENTQKVILFNCKYTDKGIEFNFKDNNSEDYINITLERIEGKKEMVI